MALGMVSGRFQFQRATKAEWEQSEIVLLDGEIAIESDTTKMKAGDGRSVYADLPYISIGDFSFSDLSEEDKKRVQGKKGDPFTYEDFTQKQLDALKGKKGDPFTYEDFTKEQLASLVGPKGDAFKFEDFTDEQLEKLGVYITDISKKGDDNIITFKGGKQLVVKDGTNGKNGVDGKDAEINLASISKLKPDEKKKIRDVLDVLDEENLLKKKNIARRINDIATSNAIFAMRWDMINSLNIAFADGALDTTNNNKYNVSNFFGDATLMNEAIKNPRMMRAILDSPIALYYMGKSPTAIQVLKDNWKTFETNLEEWNDENEYQIEVICDYQEFEVKAGETEVIDNLSIAKIYRIYNTSTNDAKIHCRLLGCSESVNTSETFTSIYTQGGDGGFFATRKLTILNNFEDSCDITIGCTFYY